MLHLSSALQPESTDLDTGCCCCVYPAHFDSRQQPQVAPTRRTLTTLLLLQPLTESLSQLHLLDALVLCSGPALIPTSG